MAETMETYEDVLMNPNRQEAKIEDLKRRYAGQISANRIGPAAIEMAAIVINLMKEWNPVLGSVSDLKAIMGIPTREQPGVLEYDFDSGIAGNMWRFKVQGDSILGVELVLLD
jgi:hypothetical protein